MLSASVAGTRCLSHINQRPRDVSTLPSAAAVHVLGGLLLFCFFSGSSFSLTLPASACSIVCDMVGDVIGEDQSQGPVIGVAASDL